MNEPHPYECAFPQMLEYLLSTVELTKAQAGIIRQVISKGYESLFEKQKSVFDDMLDKHVISTCTHCCEPIPPSEIFEAQTNGGLCGYCAHLKKKLENE